MIRILVTEDNPMVRKGICRLLAGEPEMETVAEAEDGKVALELLDGGLEADVLLTDLNMPVMGGWN